MNNQINEQIQNYVKEVMKAADGKEATEVKFTITAVFTWKKELAVGHQSTESA